MEPQWIRVVFRRRVFIIALILVQLAFILFAIAGTHYAFRYVDFILRAFSIIVCVYILNKKENSAYKLTWVFLILLFPLFGGAVYVFFHTQSSPRKLKRQMEKTNRRYRPLFLPAGGSVIPEMAALHRECLPQVHYLQEYAGFPVYKYTQTTYFNSGESFFAQALEELRKAEKYIFLEFFIIRQGKMLDPILDILEEKAGQGLDVRIIYDDLGCFMSLPPKFNKTLEKRGIKCMVFNPFKPILSSLQNNRDHRKIISIDGKVAFTGGINLADEYINAKERFGHWKDAAIMLEGEAAWSLALIFLHMWNLERKEHDQDDAASFYPSDFNPPDLDPTDRAGMPARQIESDGYVQPYADSPIDKENVGEHVYIQIINNAKEYVYINTPYLVIDNTLLSALTLSAKSGVDVRIITPYRWDKWIVSVVSRSYYRQLIVAGVKVYEYSAGFNHSKTFVSDDRVATVGTTNLDFRSLYLHFECGVWMYKTKSVAKVKEDFLNTLAACKAITLKDCSRNAAQRIVQDVLCLFAPLM
ncbi:MAG: cardiolipin synthase [Treponema sp.]|nr:cardiolipin synthase [Treponema sp.]